MIIAAHIIGISCSGPRNGYLRTKLAIMGAAPNLYNSYPDYFNTQGLDDSCYYNSPVQSPKQITNQRSAMILYRDVKNTLNYLKEAISNATELPLTNDFTDHLQDINQINNKAFEQIKNLNKVLHDDLKNNEEKGLKQTERSLNEGIVKGFDKVRSVMNISTTDAKLRIKNYVTELLKGDDSEILIELRDLENGLLKKVTGSIDVSTNENLASKAIEAENLTILVKSSLLGFKEAINTLENIKFKEFTESVKLINGNEPNENKPESDAPNKSFNKGLNDTLDATVNMNRYMLLQMLKSYLERTTGLEIEESISLTNTCPEIKEEP